jgi:hypothetical protein
MGLMSFGELGGRKISALAMALAATLWLLGGDVATRPVSAATLIVTTTADTGPGSLRDAIAIANATPGLDNISFNIPGSGVQTIQPLSALPIITDPVIIDGSTQAGYTDVPLIELRGDQAGAAVLGAGVNGLAIIAGGSAVRALTINRFSGAGLAIGTVGENVVEGCFIGTTADGVSLAGNQDGGVVIGQSRDNRIGGTTLAARNVIAGNAPYNVSVTGSVPNPAGGAGNVVQGNYIGVDRLGLSAVAMPNTFGVGVSILYAPGTIIGGTVPGSRNVIAGHLSAGILMYGGNGTTIQGNYLGTGADGMTSLPDPVEIVIDHSDDVVVGGRTPEARNVIAGGPGSAEGIGVGGGSRIVITGNYIGVAADGRTPRLSRRAIEVAEGAEVTIGGTAPGAGNVIAGGESGGIDIQPYAVLPQALSSVTIQGNRIGVDVDGAVIAGTSAAIVVHEAETVDVGGLTPEAGNIIAGHGPASVILDHSAGRRILGNSIHAMSDLAIDVQLGATSGPTPNDPGESDGVQNFPFITSVGTKGPATTVAGRLDSRPSITYRVELFAGMANPPNGRGEPKRFLGAVNVATDTSGRGTFALGIGALGAGEWVSATATGPTSGTSEVSPAVAPIPANVLVTPTSGLHTTESGEAATFTIALATAPSGDVFVPLVSTNIAEGTVSPAVLRFTPADALTPKTVTVRGSDDAVVDGPQVYAVRVGPLQSDDPTYVGFDPTEVSVTNTDNDVPGACSPRPPVAITSVRIGPSALQVTVRATSNAQTPNNRLSELRFRAPQAVQIDVAGMTGRTGTFTAALTEHPTVATFVMRTTPAKPMTVPFDVVDGCSPWSTFVGDGGR